MAIDPVLVRHPGEPDWRRRSMLGLVVVLTMANIGAAIAATYAADEHVVNAKPQGYLEPAFTGQLIMLILAVALVDGLALVPWRSTRAVGVGVVVGTVLAAFVLFVFAYAGASRHV